MGAAALCSDAPVCAPRGHEAPLLLSNANSSVGLPLSGSSDSCSNTSTPRSVSSSVEGEEFRVSFAAITQGCEPAELLRQWLPVHRTRIEKHGVVSRETRARRIAVEALEEEASQERAIDTVLSTEISEFRFELRYADSRLDEQVAARDEFGETWRKHESKGERQRETYSEVRVLKDRVAADVASLRGDLAELRHVEAWAMRQRDEEDARVCRLVEDLRVAERSLIGNLAECGTLRFGGSLAASTSKQQVKVEEVAESRAASLAWRGRQSAIELEAKLGALRLKSIQEEHYRASLEQEVNTEQRALDIYMGRRGPQTVL